MGVEGGMWGSGEGRGQRGGIGELRRLLLDLRMMGVGAGTGPARMGGAWGTGRRELGTSRAGWLW